MKLLNTNIEIQIYAFHVLFYVLYRQLEHITYVAYVCFNFLFLFLKFSTINTFFVLKINTKSPINDNVHYD